VDQTAGVFNRFSRSSIVMNYGFLYLS